MYRVSVTRILYEFFSCVVHVPSDAVHKGQSRNPFPSPFHKLAPSILSSLESCIIITGPSAWAAWVHILPFTGVMESGRRLSIPSPTARF